MANGTTMDVCLQINRFKFEKYRRKGVFDHLRQAVSGGKLDNSRFVSWQFGKIIELLKEHGITAFSQEAGGNVAMYGMSGFGIYGVDVFVETNEAKKAIQTAKQHYSLT